RVLQQDRWLLESVQRPGGVTLPRLKWARRDKKQPDGDAHLALVFDAFPSSVKTVPLPDATGSYEVHGLALSPDRQFEVREGVATWRVQVPTKFEGEKHPVARVLSERLVKSHAAVLVAVARWLGGDKGSWPVLTTHVSRDLEELFGKLHRQCDWVITADRNAGVEYFDSPEALSKVYDAYLIDCVPEREDLGFLQLITSTACLDEVTGIFAEALGGMGLSSSPTNCSFLLNALKALSGRLALRLAGSGKVVQEMIALALTQSHCIAPDSDRSKWPSLSEGFFVPLDDVPDLLKHDQAKTGDEAERRADLLYVTAEKRGGLRFAFYEVKYRNTLRSARNQEMCAQIQEQLDASCKRWDARFGEGISALERTLRRASLAKTLRFYSSKARRHGLSEEAYARISREIERMLREPATVLIPSMVQAQDARQGFVFCPEYAGRKPDELTHGGDAKLWLFGPDLLPDGNSATPDPFLYQPLALSPPDVSTQTIGQKMSLGLDTIPVVEPADEQFADPIDASKAIINLGTVLPGEAPVEWVVGTNGNPHLLIVGQPGMGKTHCLIRLCQQLHEQGIAPIVFSFHQDIDEKLMATVPGGVQTVSYEGLGFNPMEVIAAHPQAYVESVDMLRDVFSAIFPDLGEVQLGGLRKALKKSYEDQGWSSDGSRGKTPGFGDFLGILQATPKVDQKMLNRLEELADYGDEAHRAAKLKLIPTMAKECRKFGLSLILASQEIKDFDQSLFAAVSNSLTLRLLEADAQKMAKNFGIPYDKVKLYADRIKQMPKFQALFNREGLREPVKVALGV
ncbi:MAG: ATP-binding protein, partial [Betaproteobacteria bacterium]|nr:ATP-binding protein [Betaproteobacteria bacterium]